MRTLTLEEIDSFRRDGYIAPLPAFDEHEVRELRAAVAQHLSGAAESERYELVDDIKVVNVAPEGAQPEYEYRDEAEYPNLREFPLLFNLWKADSRFARAAHNETLVGYARQLLDTDEVLLMEDNVVVKTPHSKYLPWHQDYSYWPLGEPNAVTVWIALDDIDGSNGAMEIAPGTQFEGERLPVRFKDASTFMDEERPGVGAVPTDPRTEGYPVHTYRLRAGDCGVHDALVWHGSTPNTTERIRCAFIVRYVAGGTLWLGNARIPYLDVACPVGGRLTAEHFPLAGAGAPALKREPSAAEVALPK